MNDVERPGDLYGLDPAEFTAARTALAKRLRSEGRREEAKEVAGLRRPPATAWALNMVARRQPEVVGEVLERGGELRSAMSLALAGDGGPLRAARAGERRAVEAATASAASFLEFAGHKATDLARRRMAATLRAAVVDEAVAALLREGVLPDDFEEPGFGVDPPEIAAVPAQDEAAELLRRAQLLHEEATAAEGRATAAGAALLRAEAEADAAARRVEELRAEAARAHEEAAQARAAAVEAAEQAGG